MKLKFYPKYIFNIYLGKTFPHLRCKLSFAGFVDTFVSLFLFISLIYHLLDVTLFSFQGTIFEYELFIRRRFISGHFELIYADSGFSPIPTRMLDTRG